MIRKILVIDDDETSRKTICKTLENAGFCAIQSNNGKHAWETLWLIQDTVLIITDMMMPDLDGRELTLLIRGNSAFSSLPILIISGVVDHSELSNVTKLPRVQFTTKPVTASALLSLTEEMISGS